MAKKKKTPKKRAAKKAAKKTTSSRRKTAKRKPARKASSKKAPAKKATRKKTAAKMKAARKAPARRVAASRKAATPRRSHPYWEEDKETTSADFDLMEPPTERGLGLESGGQSGDTEGLSRSEIADSESVEELVEEGQAFEAGVVSGVEDAPDADEDGVRTREVPEDDVPQEYLDEQ